MHCFYHRWNLKAYGKQVPHSLYLYGLADAVYSGVDASSILPPLTFQPLDRLHESRARVSLIRQRLNYPRG